MMLKEANETVPRRLAALPTARQPAPPDPCGRGTEMTQCLRVAGDPVVRELVQEFLIRGPEPSLDWKVADEGRR